MPDEISSMGKTHGNASLLCKKCFCCGYKLFALFLNKMIIDDIHAFEKKAVQ
jgi:hypothetical protein